MEKRRKLIQVPLRPPDMPLDATSITDQLSKKVEESYEESHKKREYIPPVPDPPILVFNAFKIRIENLIRDSVQKAIREASEEGVAPETWIEPDEDIKGRITYNTETRVINKILSELDLLIEHVNQMKKRTWEPPKWMAESKMLWENIQRTRFVQVYAWLRNNTLRRRDKKTWEIIDKAGGHCWHGDYPDKRGAIEHIVCMPDFRKMSQDLSMGEKNLAIYLKKLSEIGVIKCLPERLGKGGRKVYAIGERRGFHDRERNKAGRTSRWYLKETKEIKEGLRELKIRGKKL